MRFLCSALSATSACCVMSGCVSSRRAISMRFGLRVTRAASLPTHAGERRREEQRLALLRHARDDRVDLVLEAHVEHAVGLVQHQELHAPEVHAAAVHVVLEPARRRDRRCRATASAARAAARTACRRTEQRGARASARCSSRASPSAPASRARAWARAPACAGPCPESSPPCAAAAARQHEGGGLAASRLRRDQQIAARQHRGNRFALHRRRPGIAEAREVIRKGRIQTERREAHGISLVAPSLNRLARPKKRSRSYGKLR